MKIKVITTMVLVCFLHDCCANFTSYQEFKEKFYEYVPALPEGVGLSRSRRSHTGMSYEYIVAASQHIAPEIQNQFRKEFSRELALLYKPVSLERASSMDSLPTGLNRRRELLTMKQSCIRSLERAHSLVTVKEHGDDEERVLLYSSRGKLLASTRVQGSQGEFNLNDRIERQEGTFNRMPWFTRGRLTWNDRHGDHYVVGYDNTMLILHYSGLQVMACRNDETVLAPTYAMRYSTPGGEIVSDLGKWGGVISALNMTSEKSFLIAWERDSLAWYHIDVGHNFPVQMVQSYEHVGRTITDCCGTADLTRALYVLDHKELYLWNLIEKKTAILLKNSKRIIKHIDIHPRGYCYVVVFEDDGDRVHLYDFKRRKHVWDTKGYLARFDSAGNLIVVEDAEDNHASVRRYYCPSQGDFSFLQEMMFIKAYSSGIGESILEEKFVCAPIARKRALT